MISCMKIELWKAFRQKLFWISLSIGLAISIIDSIQNYTIVSEFERLKVSAGCEGYSLFIRWLAINGDTLGNAVFANVWPILAALPFGWSYLSEKKNSYASQVLSRASRRNYLISKYIAVFISGGIIILATLLLNLLINALICPAVLPRVTSMLTPIMNRSFLPELYYSHPWIYALLWCGISFFYGGAIACVCLLFGTYVKVPALLVLLPFGLAILIDYIYSIVLSRFSFDLELSPLRLIFPATHSWNPAWLVLTVLGILVLLTFLSFYVSGRRHELF